MKRAFQQTQEQEQQNDDEGVAKKKFKPEPKKATPAAAGKKNYQSPKGKKPFNKKFNKKAGGKNTSS